MLHEGGHAFHTIATRDEPVLEIAKAPIEFCEVASMAMELFGAERATAIYPERDAADLLASLIEARYRLFTWVATIDSFQHWLYTHPGHSRAERESAWVERRTRFEPDLDWSGLEDVRAGEWTGQQHLFNNALYYIEYALAWMGAVQVWERFREDPERGVAGYREALALGGKRPLPELFAAAGARFGTDGELVRATVESMGRRLAELTSS
jgi:oligoendopeptidase F